MRNRGLAGLGWAGLGLAGYNCDMISLVVISVVAGFVVGMLAGLVGIGGGTLLVPVFTVCYGMAPVMATGTSLFTIVFTSLAGALTRLNNHTCNVKMGVLLGVGGALTSPLGAYAATRSPEIVVVLAVAVVIVYSAATTLRKALRPPAAKLSEADTQVPDAPAEQKPAPVFALQCLGIGVVTGLASGYVGLGGGFIMVPLMCNFLGVSMKEASGTSLLAIILIAASGAAAQCVYGNVDVLVGLFVACGSIPGAIVGGSLVTRFNDRVLRFIFAGFLLVAAVLLVVRQAGLLG